MNSDELESTEQRIARLRVEIGQYRIANRNHIDYCAFEIARREREIEILYEAEQKRETKAEVSNAS